MHAFFGRGTYKLAWQQNSTFASGATLSYRDIKIVATEDSSLHNVAITH